MSENLFEEHAGYLRGIARRRFRFRGDREELAEEAVQETFCTVARLVGQGKKKISDLQVGYFVTVLQSRVYDILDRERRHIGLDNVETHEYRLASDRQTPEQIERRMTLQRLRSRVRHGVQRLLLDAFALWGLNPRDVPRVFPMLNLDARQAGRIYADIRRQLREEWLSDQEVLQHDDS